jgi:flagellar basal-body rod protein FlgG
MILEVTRPVQGGLRQERKLESVSNNLANAETIGFKKDTISFDLKFKAQVNKDFSQGSFQTTGNALDVALSGEGFFKIETPEGIRYTRNGNFSLDLNGVLVDQNGNPVLGQGGAIVIVGEEEMVEEALSINQIGEIMLGEEIIDTLDIVTFEDKRKLEREAENLLSYKGPTTDEIQVEQTVVQHRTLENSNIQVVDEMVRMIDYHRMFETFTKSILTFDEVDNKAINDVGKLR